MEARMLRKSNHVGRAIATLRAKRCMTHEQVAVELQKRGIDISRQVVANIESGNCSPTDQEIYYFAALFGVSIESLLTVMRKRKVPDVKSKVESNDSKGVRGSGA